MLQMVHPDRVVDEAGFAKLPLVEPVYPLTEGLVLGHYGGRWMARWPACPIYRNGRTTRGFRASVFPPLPRALRHLHRPAEPHDIAPETSGLDAARL